LVTRWVPPDCAVDLVELMQSDQEHGKDLGRLFSPQGPGARSKHCDAATHALDTLGGAEVEVHDRTVHERVFGWRWSPHRR
jgi:hypothetical protein